MSNQTTQSKKKVYCPNCKAEIGFKQHHCPKYHQERVIRATRIYAKYELGFSRYPNQEICYQCYKEALEERD